MDKLEKFILHNRAEFDEERNPEEGWERLNDKLDPHTSQVQFHFWKVAAVIFFISTVALLVTSLRERPSQDAQVSSSSSSIESYFIQVIDVKRSEYSALANDGTEEEFFKDLAELDSAYDTLKESYEQFEREEMLTAMLENLQLRVLILNEQIEILKNNDNETVEVYHAS